MKRIRTVGLCLAAVFALSVIAASGASATDLLARIAGGGSVAGVTFLSSATLLRWITHSGTEFHCKHVTNHGLFLSLTLGIVLMRFLGCSTKFGFTTIECKTKNAAAGEIHLPLSTLFHLGLAHLGINSKIPALVILPGSATEVSCGGLVMNWTGALIGVLQKENGEPLPLSTPLGEMNLNFQQTGNGLQHLRLILMPGSITPTTYDLEFNVGGALELLAVITNDKLHLFRLSNGGNHVNIELIAP